MKRKIICIVLTIIMTLLAIQSFIYASDGAEMLTMMNNMTTQAGDPNVAGAADSLAGVAITIAQIIAIGVAIIMLIVLAMKYMISAPGDRATIKKHAVVYIVGAIVMFATTGILGIIKNLAKAFTPAGGSAVE